jgi:hypothetical protein
MSKVSSHYPEDIMVFPAAISIPDFHPKDENIIQIKNL